LKYKILRLYKGEVRRLPNANFAQFNSENKPGTTSEILTLSRPKPSLGRRPPSLLKASKSVLAIFSDSRPGRQKVRISGCNVFL
jgi:hypothetical protein